MWQYGKLPKGWSIKKIGEYASVITDYVANGSFAALAENVNYKSEPDYAVLIRLTDYNNNFSGDFVYIDENAYEFLSKSKLYGNEIIISNVGANVGTVFKCPKLQKKMSLAPNAIMLKTKGNDDFYYYWFMSRNGQHSLQSIVTGSAQPKFNKTNFKELLVPVPPLDVQEKTAEYLRNIDKKIELNKKINENLEQQALALFRHYFMDFEPYGCSAPSSWSKVSLDDVCTRITDGSHYSPSDVPDAPYPMYSVKNMETYGFDSTSCKHITAEDFHKMQKNDCVPRLNDILVAKDGSYLKEIFICSEEKDEAILSSIAIFRPNTEVIIPEILLYLLKQPAVRKDVGDNYVSGSALPRIVLKDFKKYTFLLPPMTEQLKIGAILHTIRMKTKTNIDEIQILSALRDTFLPQLMSGELDVSEIKF